MVVVGQARGGVAVEVGRGGAEAVAAGGFFEGGGDPSLALGDGDVDRGQEQLEDGVGVVAQAAVALAGVAAGEARGDQRREAEARGRRGRCRGRPCRRGRSAVSEPMMPGPGPTRTASQPSAVGGVEGADGAERLVLAAVGRGGGDVAAEQAALAQLGDVAGERARQGAAARLHVADPQPRRRLRRRPGRRRQVAVQRQDSTGRSVACSFRPHTGHRTAHRCSPRPARPGAGARCS